jgi:hypothetical protein
VVHEGLNVVDLDLVAGPLVDGEAGCQRVFELLRIFEFILPGLNLVEDDLDLGFRLRADILLRRNDDVVDELHGLLAVDPVLRHHKLVSRGFLDIWHNRLSLTGQGTLQAANIFGA